MKNLIVGNGVNIQFGGSEYFNNQILERAIFNLDNGNFNDKIYPKEIGQYFLHLVLFAKEILKGNKDSLVVTSFEKEILPQFKIRNREAIISMNYKMIGLEDYLFIHHMFCRDNGIKNPTAFYITKFLERLFLDSIYNNGKLERVYTKFPKKFIRWLNAFDNYFTTNYDSNLDKVIETEIYHLHGSFEKLSDVYNPDSLRNKLKLDEYDYIKGFDHLYSDALLDYSGYGKKFSGLQAERTNAALEKFARVLTEESLSSYNKEIDSWKNSNSQILMNLCNAIYEKHNNPNIKFEDHYHFSKFRLIEGELTFLGLSPHNDNHIIEMIRSNNAITKIKYFYYSHDESIEIDKCFPNKEVEKIKVKKFWKKF